MLPLRNRLRKEKDIQNVFRKGRDWHLVPFRLKIVKTNSSYPFQVAIVVSSRVAKKAVTRNKIRRRAREAMRQIIPSLTKTGWQGLLLVGAEAEHMDFQELIFRLKIILHRASLTP